jgi:hypothetical protein
MISRRSGPSWRAQIFAGAFDLGLMFSAGLIALAVYASHLPEARDYQLAAPAKAASLAAMDAAIREAVPPGPQQLRDFLISAIDAGENELARGVMLSLGNAALPDGQRLAQFQASLPPEAQESLRFAAEEANTGLRARQAALVISPDGQAGIHSIAADTLRALAQRAQEWQAGQPVDDFNLMLSGFDLAISDQHEGIQLLRLARRAGRLNPRYEAHWRAALAAALPAPALRRTLATAKAHQADPQFPVEIPQAFRAALDPAAANAVLEEFGMLSALRASAQTPGALILIAHAHSPNDAMRLRLAAEIGKDRAAALALLKGREAVLRTIPGQLRMTPSLRAVLGLLAACAALMGIGIAGCMACEWPFMRRANGLEEELF